MIILVNSVQPLDGFEVRLGFSTGEQKTVDLKPFLRGPIFEPILNNRKLFLTVHVDDELGTIVWDNGADIDPDVLYGTQIPAWMEDEEKAQV